MQTTESIFAAILESSLFRTNGKRLDLVAEIITLCDAIKAEEETNWNLGEFQDCTLDSFLVGAYWALSEWHGGQASDTYAALCAVGSIFSTGYTLTPTEDENEYIPYQAVCSYFKSRD